jgi:hypothetical protein
VFCIPCVLRLNVHNNSSFIFAETSKVPKPTMNNPQASNGSSRQPSPTSFEVASELLRFVSQSSCKKRAAPILAPASLITLPASIVPLAAAPTKSDRVAAAPFGGFVHPAPTSGAPSASAPSIAKARLDCSTDGHLRAPPPRMRPSVNRPIDHTYTDFAPISDVELRRLDFDVNIFNDPKLSPEKKRLMEMLRKKISRTGCLVSSFPPKVCFIGAV